jgi:hypothetical protein
VSFTLLDDVLKKVIIVSVNTNEAAQIDRFKSRLLPVRHNFDGLLDVRDFPI